MASYSPPAPSSPRDLLAAIWNTVARLEIKFDSFAEDQRSLREEVNHLRAKDFAAGRPRPTQAAGASTPHLRRDREADREKETDLEEYRERVDREKEKEHFRAPKESKAKKESREEDRRMKEKREDGEKEKQKKEREKDSEKEKGERELEKEKEKEREKEREKEKQKREREKEPEKEKETELEMEKMLDGDLSSRESIEVEKFLKDRKEESVRQLGAPRKADATEDGFFSGEADEDAFQQAWLELENHRQKKLGSLGRKDLDALLKITALKLSKGANPSGPIASAKGREKRRAKHHARWQGRQAQLRFPLDPAGVERLVAELLAGLSLAPEHANRLVEDCSRLFLEEPNLLDLKIPSNGRVAVVGDIHGQLIDLSTILRRVGYPSDKNILVFNGDFVDRGPHGPEVLWVLFALKLAWPLFVILHRGNHEEARINRVYQFEQQIRAKYDATLFTKIGTVFTHLPIGSLLQNSCLVIHGGLPRDSLTLEEIRSINRHQEVPRPEDCTTPDLKILEALLWSDPVEDVETFKESTRGAGIFWGRSLTKQFLTTNGLELLVRSHQLCPAGHRYNHLKRVLTIFSASYYCGVNTNKGAVVIFDNESGIKSPHFIEYHAEVAHVGVRSLQKHETLAKLHGRIFKKRRKLFEAFVSFDPDRTGFVTKKQWVKVMNKVLKLPLQWEPFLPYLVQQVPQAIPNQEAAVAYLSFLDRFKIDVGDAGRKINKVIQKRVVDRIVQNSMNLREAFALYAQRTQQESIPIQDFVAILHDYAIGFSKTMLFDFVRRLDSNKDGRISQDEFLRALEPTFNKAVNKEDLPWIQTEISRLSTALSSPDELRSLFGAVRSKKAPWVVQYKTWSKLLSTAHARKPDIIPAYSDLQKRKMYSFIDQSEGEMVAFEDLEAALFGGAFLAEPQAGRDTESLLQDRLWRILYSRRHLFRDLLLRVDEEATGLVDVDEFRAALEAFNELHGRPLSKPQLELLVASVAVDEDGLVDYEAFIATLNVVDVNAEEEEPA